MKTLLLACVVVALAVSRLHALGPGKFDGETDEGWDAKHYSVIVAKVLAVERAPDASWQATLVPMNTVAGKFDASEHPTLDVRSFGSSLVPEFIVPKAGDIVLTVVTTSKAPGGGWVVPFTYATFMPGASSAPLCVVDGPGDPRVAETLKKIQEARARGRAKAAERGAAEERRRKEFQGEPR